MPRPVAIQPVSDANRFKRWLIHGDPGCGKTPMIAQLDKCLILDGEGGDSTVAAAINGSTAHRWVMDDWTAMEEAYEFAKHDNARTKEFEWIWLDPLSLFQEVGLDHIMTDLVAAKSNRVMWGADKGEYGQNMNRISKWVRDMKGLPVNFGIITHTFRVEDVRTGELVFMPMVTGKGMSTKIAGYFGLVTYMDVIEDDEGKPVPRLRTQKSEEYFCRNRYGGLPGLIKNPDAKAIYRKISQSNPKPPAKAAAAKVTKGARPALRPLKKAGS